MIFISKILDFCGFNFQSTVNQIIGSGWLLYMISGFTTNSMLLIQYIISYLELNKEEHPDTRSIQNFLGYLIGYCVFFILLSLIFRNRILKFFNDLTVFQNEGIDQIVEKNKKGEKLTLIEDITKKKWPFLLHKLNSTYYKFVDKQFNTQVKESKKQKFKTDVNQQITNYEKNLEKCCNKAKNINVLKQEINSRSFVDIDSNMLFSARSHYRLNNLENSESIIKMEINQIEQEKKKQEQRKERAQTLPAALKQENQNNNSNASNDKCLICCNQEQNAVFLDCGHGGICYQCAIDIFKKNGECHLCRLSIQQVLKLNIQPDYDQYEVIQSARYQKKD